MEIVHLKRRYEQVTIHIQTISPRTEAGNIKSIVMIGVFTRYVRTIPIPDERAETLPKLLLDECIPVFRPIQKLLTDGGTNLVNKVAENLVENLSVGNMELIPVILRLMEPSRDETR